MKMETHRCLKFRVIYLMCLLAIESCSSKKNNAVNSNGQIGEEREDSPRGGAFSTDAQFTPLLGLVQLMETERVAYLKKMASEESSIARLDVQRNLLCPALQSYREKCEPSRYLLLENQFEKFRCPDSTQYTNQHDLTIKISGVPEGVKLKFNDLVSQPISSNGVVTPVLFSDGSLLAQKSRLAELKSLKLLAPAVGVGFWPNSPILEIRSHSTVLFNQTHLEPFANGAKEVSFDLSYFDALSEKQECLSSSEVVENAEVSSMEKSLLSSKSFLERNFAGKSYDQLLKELKKIDVENKVFKEDLAKFMANRFEFEKQMSELKNDLLFGVRQSCALNEKVTKLELVFNWNIWPNMTSTNFYSVDPRETKGEGKRFVLRMGGNLLPELVDPKTSSDSTGNLPTTIDLSGKNLMVKDLLSIQLVKQGETWSSQKSCTKNPDGMNECKFVNQELDLYKLDSLRIRVNDKVLLQKNDVNHTFRSGNLDWYFFDFHKNSDFVNFIEENECGGDGD